MGEESRLARSFERIRSIVRKNRFARKAAEGGEGENGKLQKLVNEIVVKQREEKVKGILVNANQKYLEAPYLPTGALYSHSYQVSRTLFCC